MTTATATLPHPSLLNGRITEALSRKIKIYPRNSLWVSQLDHACMRYLEYGILRWQDQLKHSADLQEIFDEGHVHEAAVLAKLTEAGFRTRQTQRPLFEKVMEGRKEMRYGISGRLDLEINHPDVTGEDWYPAEIKSMEPYGWESIEGVEDLLKHKRWYLRMYPGQLMMYLYAMGRETGLMILKNKVNGKLKFIWITIDLDVIERMLQKAEEVNRVVAEVQGGAELDATLTPRVDYDEKLCGSCSFRHICLPDARHGGQTIELSQEVADKLERREILKSYADEYKDLDENIKDGFKARGDGKYLVGAGFDVTVATSPRKAYQVAASDVTRVTIRKVGS